MTASSHLRMHANEPTVQFDWQMLLIKAPKVSQQSHLQGCAVTMRKDERVKAMTGRVEGDEAGAVWLVLTQTKASVLVHLWDLKLTSRGGLGINKENDDVIFRTVSFHA